MGMLSTFISFMSLIFNIITFTKLHIVYIPMIACELLGANEQTKEIVLMVSVALWIAAIVKSIINLFKK